MVAINVAVECERSHQGHDPVGTVLVGGTACCAMHAGLIAAMVCALLDWLGK